MIALVASFFSLFVGPLVYQTFGPLRRTDKIVSGLVLVIVGGIILLDILPQTIEEIGYLAVVLLLFGFAGPSLIESTFRKAADKTHRLTIYLGLFGLLVHALIDGAALQTDQIQSSNRLTLALLIHRIPVGLTIWWLLKPILGERAALLMLLFMGFATVSGFFLNQTISQFESHGFIVALQALVSGSLLHVVVYKPHPDGCLHTSDSHSDHSHVAHSHAEHSHSSAQQVNLEHNSLPHTGQLSWFEETRNALKTYLTRWELTGIAIGSAVLFAMNWYSH